MKNRKNETAWCLKGELRDNTPWIIPIDRPLFSIGRQDSNDLILPSQAVSRRHARISMDSSDLFIEDLESKNGIRLNGNLLTEKSLLRPGDIIKIGESEFTLSRFDELEEDTDEQTLVRNLDKTRISFADAYGLSERENEILFFLIKGHSLKKIGESLFISPGTVKNHVLKIYKKTGCHSRIELSTKAAGFSG